MRTEAKGDLGEAPSSKKLWLAVKGGPPSTSFAAMCAGRVDLAQGKLSSFPTGPSDTRLDHALSEYASVSVEKTHLTQGLPRWFGRPCPHL